ncbi:uncharacterized protein LOC111406814 [Olea europaea var. sylvestris]|uniref:uncharacterized protein LOC111406814 n=1 Tax=Olea europaea var. sylvestris TaxID=158386 RepID=UPI000C1D4BD0|nr:uncharacterized protein LOC111406814 [Olea europaea var. sylvestris]
MSCNDAQKVSCAKFMLINDAGHWWDSETHTKTAEQLCNLTWNQFKESLMGKYFSRPLRDQKEVEFLQLAQGNLPLGGYERKFEQLSRYAPHMVNTELTKTKRFEMGLKPEIKGIMAAQQYTTYAEVVRRAQAISNGLGLEKKPQPDTEISVKRKWQGHDKGRNQNQKVKIWSNSNKTFPQCSKCNKRHLGKCHQGKELCYICDKSGHFLRGCSEKKKEGDQLKKGKARVFALTGEKEDQNIDVITGMLPVFDIPAIVLMDSGSTHSFISMIFMDKIGNECVETNNILEVSTPSEEVINTDQMVKSVKLEIEGKVLKVDLYILGMKDFDVILGMDWLGRNYITIICHKNEVLFQKPGEEKF